MSKRPQQSLNTTRGTAGLDSALAAANAQRDVAREAVLEGSLRRLRDEIGIARKRLAEQAVQLETLLSIDPGVRPYAIKPKVGHRTSEAVLGVALSDTHIEESVRPEMVNGLNWYDLDESAHCMREFFRRTERLFRLYAADVEVTSLVVWLGGDLISGSIHADLAETNLLPPADAILRCKDDIVSGLEFLLNEIPNAVTIHVPCHTGNHGRFTPERRVQSEPGNSLERLMYCHVATHFRGRSRITFDVSEAYHSFLPVFGRVWRFHHGHAINFGGGVGGITIPVAKAIARWNEGITADLDVFGHFHQALDGGRWISNGSMIGHSPYAVSVVKAGFSEPKQQAWLWDRDRGRTFTSPILFPGRMSRLKTKRSVGRR